MQGLMDSKSVYHSLENIYFQTFKILETRGNVGIDSLFNSELPTICKNILFCGLILLKFFSFNEVGELIFIRIFIRVCC